MSQYLIERIEALPNVDVVIGCEIAELEGRAGSSKESSVARPRTRGGRDAGRALPLLLHRRRAQHRLAGSFGLKLDPRGFVLTGDEVRERSACRWRPAGAACSRSATFASRSVKRVAASVGDGAQVVAAIHAYLAKQQSVRIGS